MKIGDLVTWRGRRYRLRGFDPMGVVERRAYLDDEEAGRCVLAPVEELEDSRSSHDDA